MNETIYKICEEALQYKGWSITSMYHERSEALEIIQKLIDGSHTVFFCPNCNAYYAYNEKEPLPETCNFCDDPLIVDIER